MEAWAFVAGYAVTVGAYVALRWRKDTFEEKHAAILARQDALQNNLDVLRKEFKDVVRETKNAMMIRA